MNSIHVFTVLFFTRMLVFWWKDDLSWRNKTGNELYTVHVRELVIIRFVYRLKLDSIDLKNNTIFVRIFLLTLIIQSNIHILSNPKRMVVICTIIAFTIINEWKYILLQYCQVQNMKKRIITTNALFACEIIKPDYGS